jgi:Tfp pilus assembly protein PilF/peroxiredoxin
MVPRKIKKLDASRREFIKAMGWAPALLFPAQFHGLDKSLQFLLSPSPVSLPFADFHVTPHYRSKSPLDDLLAKVDPHFDNYATEQYAAEISEVLQGWTRELTGTSPRFEFLKSFLDPNVEATTFSFPEQETLRSRTGIKISRRRPGKRSVIGRDQFLQEFIQYLSAFSILHTAEFHLVGIAEPSPSQVECEILYELLGARGSEFREQRTGTWKTQWTRENLGKPWRVKSWEAIEETLSEIKGPGFIDITANALSVNESYEKQMLHGVDYWRAVLDGACGIDVYGNNGVAVGDIDNDGFDEIYVCQPAGLPNRLYRNRGDGIFDDITDRAGVGVLDSSSCALFADFQNQGLQDLLVVCGNGPLLFLNEGNGKFSLKPNAFKFEQPPQGTFTHAAIADYDRDGRLDIYFCLYSYYAGLDQYHYPSPYFDARNGPANFLFYNLGNATFEDRTVASGLNAENDRYSFACAWGDANSDGWPDLYVANDFGRSNLYRNNGDGTFSAISAKAGVQDAGAGMSACWADFNGDGHQDIYVANMWSAAGQRISGQTRFHEKDPENIRGFYRQHAQGNSLYRNLGNSKFANIATASNANAGRWAWSSDAFDFDHDGQQDIYVANGYITGRDPRDLSSFFWRQVVGQSPPDALPSSNYERGWNAINELIRSDSSWSAPERNVVFANHGDGTFSDIAGLLGLDFRDDSRSFALADIDHDGRLEIILKNRNAPQIRILRNAMTGIGNSIVFRLQGTKSNRDAIGAAITIETDGKRQTKYLQAGSGFLSQHSKEVFFGIGNAATEVKAQVRWPSGIAQSFDHLPVNHRIGLMEGSPDFTAKSFSATTNNCAKNGIAAKVEVLPLAIETWLMEPLSAPSFALPNDTGKMWELKSFRGKPLLLNFWQVHSATCKDQLRVFGKVSAQLQIAAINVDLPLDDSSVKSFLRDERFPFPILLASEEVVGIYNLMFRYLYDRRRDLPVPTSFLLDGEGMIVKVYQGAINPERAVNDLKTLSMNSEERVRRNLPFNGTLYESVFQRNEFTYGVAFFQRGYLDQAVESFKQVIAAKPEDAEANYNLGTLYLRRNDLANADKYLQQTVRLRPDYPEAWNNLGMLAAQQGNPDEAVRNFRQALMQRPAYAVALVNLANLYRRQKSFAPAQELFNRALKLEPDNPEFNYSYGMFYAQQDQFDLAAQYLNKAIELRPNYAEAINNLGVLFVRQQRYPEAEATFRACIQTTPDFDQAYMNLARLYVILSDNDKAKEVLQTLLRRQPQHKAAQQALDMLH